MPTLATVFCVSLALASLPGAGAFLEGDNAQRRGRHAEAIPAFLNASELDPDLRPYAEIRVADALRAQGDRPGALAAYQRVIAHYPEGPWVRLAHARLAQLHLAQSAFIDAARHFGQVFDLGAVPWSIQPLELASAEAMLQKTATQPQAMDIYRRTVQRSILAKDRLPAALRLVHSPVPGDRMIAIGGMLRSVGVDHAGQALVTHTGMLRGPEGGSVSLAELTALVVRNAADQARLDAIVDANADNPWLRFWLNYAARTQATKVSNAAAVPMCRALAQAAPDTLEAGDVLWWVADRLARQDEIALAEELFLLLARTCVAHFRSDDAWVRVGELRLGEGKRAAALEAFASLAEQQPGSTLRAEADYRASDIARALGQTERAMELLRRAAAGTLGNYYAHRALERLPETPEGPAAIARNLKIDGARPVLRPQPGLESPVLPLPEFVAKDPRVRRLQFFGDHGLEEGEWEAMGLCAAMAGHENPAPYYRAAAEAGFGHTAERFATLHGWGLKDGQPTPARRRLSYPLAYWPQFKALAKEVDVDPFLMMAMARQESTFRATIKSHAGAAGVMQVMPGTADWLAKVEPNIHRQHVDNLDSAVNSIRLGAYYIMRMSASYNGNLVFATAAYNAGPGNVNKWRKRFPNHSLDDFVEAIPFNETRDYVKKVLGNYAAYHSLYPAPDTLP